MPWTAEEDQPVGIGPGEHLPPPGLTGEGDEMGVTESKISVAGDHLGTDLAPTVVEISLARWRYSWVTTLHPDPCLVASYDPPLLFCGDAFGQPKVEGAALSGLAAADYLLGRDVP